MSGSPTRRSGSARHRPGRATCAVDRLLAAARETGAEAIHPGYGFLSENADFARQVEAAGLTFVGPTPEQLELFGAKHTARDAARAAGVPLLAGTDLLSDVDHALAEAERIGYPVMLKATAGGGGIGMRACRSAAELTGAWEAVRRMASASFAGSGVFLERLVEHARHVEVQVFGDGEGRVVAVGDRDCSLQRRNQKVMEEAPAPHLPAHVREQLAESSVALASSVHYRSAGTVEFVYDAGREEVAFLEVNTRLQVEHPVTEAVYGVDLVEWMLRLAKGDRDFTVPEPAGHAVEARVYAEDPVRDHQPSAGTLTGVDLRAWRARGQLGRAGHRGQHALRPVAGQGDRTRYVPGRGLVPARWRAGREPHRRRRDEPGPAPGRLRRGQRARGDPQHGDAGHGARPRTTHRGAAAWHDDHRPGLAWPDRVLARGRATVGPDGRPVVPAGQPGAGQPGGGARPGVHCGRPGAAVHRTPPRSASPAHRPRSPWTVRPSRGGNRWRSPPARPSTSGPRPPACGRTCWSRAGSTCRSTSAARRPSRSAGSAATAAGRCAPATCCDPARRPAPGSPSWRCRSSAHHWEIAAVEGPHAAPEFFTVADVEAFYATDWQVHFNSAGPASGWSGPGRTGHGRTAARRACTRRTSTTRRTPSAPSTTPATCRSCSVPTARASAGSSVRPPWSPGNAGSSASSGPATPSGSSRSPRPARPGHRTATAACSTTGRPRRTGRR